VDEEAARRRSVCDHALRAHAEPRVRVLLVSRDPAARVAAPAELGERLVEALRECRQHGLGVEVAGAHGLAVLDGQKPSSVRKRSRAAAAISP
jgi:hypothetical protein